MLRTTNATPLPPPCCCRCCHDDELIFHSTKHHCIATTYAPQHRHSCCFVKLIRNCCTTHDARRDCGGDDGGGAGVLAATFRSVIKRKQKAKSNQPESRCTPTCRRAHTHSVRATVWPSKAWMKALHAPPVCVSATALVKWNIPIVESV